MGKLLQTRQLSAAAAYWVGKGHDSRHALELEAQMSSTLTLPSGHVAQSSPAK